MRIIAGKYGMRKLASPKGDAIRPTSDKIRGSIFNSLASRMDLNGVRVLDLYCGSGALGLEALSRGATYVHFFDNSRDSISLAKFNAETLTTLWDCTFTYGDSSKLKANTGKAFDLFFCDPPYDKGLIIPTLKSLHEGGWLHKDAVGVLETEKSWNDRLPKEYAALQEKEYGDTKISYVEYQGA
ncbi:MAG: 16S rRNA (guanine(966)-N(2))-methyltransferase RsmD [Alphaproteobacteria bacterium]